MQDFLPFFKTLFGPRAAPLVQLRSGFPLFFDGTGKIVSIVDLWNFEYPSMVRELSAAGNIGDYFDWSPPPGNGISVVWNRRWFSLSESPETIYAAFPTAALRYLRIKNGLYFGVVRPTETAPNFHLHRSDCVIYVDPENRLMGFNEPFFRLFQGKAAKPADLLKKNLSDFLSPTPFDLARRALSLVPPPKPEAMTSAWSLDFSAPERSGRRVGDLRLEAKDGGIRLMNPTGDHVYFVPSFHLPPETDAAVELVFESRSGWPPLLMLGEEAAGRPLPDRNEYLAGPDIEGRRYFLKRIGIIQKMGGSLGKGVTRLLFFRSGHSFFIIENGVEKLAWHDLNFLHRGRSGVALTLREGSVCDLKAFRILKGAPRAEAGGSIFPLTRARGQSGRAFLINPADCAGLSRTRPDLSAFVLSDVTEMEKQVAALRRENVRIRASLSDAEFSPVGASPAMGAVKTMAERAARLDVSVLIQGETGTGKEVLANFIHGRSARREGPLVKVDCSTIPESLFESELFGHEKGAFTGAVAQRKGLLESAQGGTLFLDEVGNLPPGVQAKLLQFLQEFKVTRLGSARAQSLNVRVIAASNVLLSDLVAQGTFRADLFYRLDVVSIRLPPLRERREDLAALCRHFLEMFNARHGRSVKDLSAGAYEKIFAHAWPGNVRELRNAIERAVVFCEDEQVPAGLILPAGTTPSAPPPGAVPDRRGGRPLAGVDAGTLGALFDKHRGVALRVAAELGVTPPALYGKIRKLRLTIGGLRRGR